MSQIELYYFSGTGNSLHVARELQRRLPDTQVIPMISLLNQNGIDTAAEAIGFVFPVYFTAIPIPVKTFIEKLDLKATRYIFAIATRIGTSHGAFHPVTKILKQKGRTLDASFTLNMASNDPKFHYKVPSVAEIARIEAAVAQRLDAIQKIVVRRDLCREKDTNCLTRIPFVRLLSLLVTLTGGVKANLYADSKCNGCGICEKVCLARKIKMVAKRPVWQPEVTCYHCGACINYCPVQAAQIKGMTEKNGRYPHPYATADDIAAQKEIQRGK